MVPDGKNAVEIMKGRSTPGYEVVPEEMSESNSKQHSTVFLSKVAGGTLLPESITRFLMPANFAQNHAPPNARIEPSPGKPMRLAVAKRLAAI